MNFSYIEQILVKQARFPKFLVQYILNFLWNEELIFWQTKFNNVMKNLVKKPEIAPIHSHNNLLSMRMFNTYSVMRIQTTPDSNIIQYDFIKEENVSIDDTYYKFHTYIARNKYI